MDEMMEALVFKNTSNWRAVGPDGLPVELLKIVDPEFVQRFHHIYILTLG